MPIAAPTPCRYPGCGALVRLSGYCDKHKQQMRKRDDERRGSSSSRGYNHRWRKYRETFLAKNPLCAECQRHGIVAPASVVDHIVPHKGDRKLFWNPGNHQSLCKRCHDHKTATDDGGFGRQSTNGHP
ncbi:MAG: HNH endonuclease [Betaproteobacteria bacterium]|nr:HNH endonuclease [Betaproteobacteria bacterium]